LKKRRRLPGGKQKTLDHFGFGLCGEAQPKFRKSFLVLFFKKDGLASFRPQPCGYAAPA
jgi:hypothetical protein